MGRKKKEPGKSPVDSSKKKEKKEIVLMFSRPDTENSASNIEKTTDDSVDSPVKKKSTPKKGKPTQIVFHF